jgi:hypothetical protein
MAFAARAVLKITDIKNEVSIMRGTVILIGVAAIQACGNTSIAVRAGFAVHDKFMDVIVFRIQIGMFGSVNLRTVYEIDGNNRIFIFAIFILLANDDKALSDDAAIGAFFDGIAVLVKADVIPSTIEIGIVVQDGITNGAEEEGGGVFHVGGKELGDGGFRGVGGLGDCFISKP